MELITRIPTDIYESDYYDEFEVSEAARIKELWSEATVNGNQKCSDFGNSECSIFGIKTTVFSASVVQ